MDFTNRTFVFLIAQFLLLPLCLGAQDHDRLAREYKNHAYRAAPQDAFPVLNNPNKVPSKRAERHLKDGEWVIGVKQNGEAQAYPIAVMGVHELINDTVGGKPITVCW